MSTGRAAGFTLLEILVALVVLGFLMVGLSQGVRFGLTAWGMQERLINQRGDLDAVDRALRQLVARMDPGTRADPPRVTGTQAEFAFTAALPLIAAAEPLLDYIIHSVIAAGDTTSGRGKTAIINQIAPLIPELADRVQELHDWKQTSLLSVAADRLSRWYKPGLLLIGDAAHIMSPAGGNGINYAVMDAVAAANILTEPLRNEQLRVADLARVQRARERPTRIIQAIVNVIQDNLIARALDPTRGFELPGFVRWNPFNELAARVMGFGIKPEHVKD